MTNSQAQAAIESAKELLTTLSDASDALALAQTVSNQTAIAQDKLRQLQAVLASTQKQVQEALDSVKQAQSDAAYKIQDIVKQRDATIAKAQADAALVQSQSQERIDAYRANADATIVALENECADLAAQKKMLTDDVAYMQNVLIEMKKKVGAL